MPNKRRLVKDANNHTLEVQELNGRLWPPFNPGLKLHLLELQQMQFRADDVLVVSYPKTGTHWAMDLAAMLHMSTTNVGGIAVYVSFLDTMPVSTFDAMPSPRRLFTHLLPQDLPASLWTVCPRIVFVVRNFKDTIVSFYHHHRNLGYAYSGSFDGYLPVQLSTGFDYGTYFDFYKHWWQKLKNYSNHLCLSYEAMKTDIFTSLVALNNFLDTKQPDEFLYQVVEASTFDSVRARRPAESVIYRKGLVGDWKSHFSPQQNAATDKRLAAFYADMDAQFVSLCSTFEIN